MASPSGFERDDFDYVCTTDDNSSSPVDLFTGLATGLITADPVFREVGTPPDPPDYELMCHEDVDSPTIDAGDPGLTSIPGHLEFDFDREDRMLDGDGDMLVITDMGADETRSIDFLRGDANDDGTFDVADPIFTLARLFNEGPPGSCDDAVDANDDAIVDTRDAMYSLAALFSVGPGLPPPHPRCGVDPTCPDNLGCRSYTHCP